MGDSQRTLNLVGGDELRWLQCHQEAPETVSAASTDPCPNGWPLALNTQVIDLEVPQVLCSCLVKVMT